MMKNNERMEKLNNAGVNTSKYFSFELPEGVPAGTTVKIMFDENGEPQMVNELDNMCKEIVENGYVRNTRLHRRWIMAQMFRMLNYKSYDGKETGYNAALKRYSYDYTFKMMLEEVRVLSILEIEDYESFNERSHFFTQRVVYKTCIDYINKLEKYVDSMPTKKCKGIPYKRVNGMNIFVADLDKKLYAPLRNTVLSMNMYAMTYTEIYRRLNAFMKNMVKLPWDTKKSPDWIYAYKGEGAYYTLKNLCLFNNCDLIEQNGLISRGIGAERRLKEIINEYEGEGWRMFALMKRVIEYNNYNFYKEMDKKYNNK